MKPSEVLAKAADLIEPPGKWRPGLNASRPGFGGDDEEPIDCFGGHAEATRWGTVAAIYAQAKKPVPWKDAQAAFLAFRQAVSPGSIAHWAWEQRHTQAGDVAELRRVSARLAEAGQ